MKKIASLLTFLALIFGTMIAPAANANDASTSIQATQPPLVPAGFIARSSADDIALLWDPIDFQAAEVPLVDTYIIRELLTQQTVEVAGLQQSYVFENLDSAIVYEFQIAARNSAGTSDFSEIARASIESSTDLKDISRLIVKYRNDISPTLSNGKPTGSEALNVDIDAGQAIGAGMRTLVLDDAITTNKAGEVVTTLNNDPRIEWAEPDVFISLSAVSNDEPSGATTLTPSGSTINQTVSNVGANNTRSIYGYAGYSDTWYKFVAPETRLVTATISSGGTLGDPILSAFTETYGFIAFNDDYSGLLPRIQFNVTAGQTYLIAFSSYNSRYQGTGNLVVSNLAAESSAPSAPTISSVTSQVNALTVNWTSATTGSAADSFTAKAYADSLLTSLAATCTATSSQRTCQLTGLTGGTTYWVTVTATNSFGSASSSTVVFEGAIDLGTVSGSYAGTISNLSGTDTASCSSQTGTYLSWYRFTAGSTGLATLEITSHQGMTDSMLFVYDSSGNALGCNDDSAGGTRPKLTLSVNLGTTYYLGLASWGNTSRGNASLQISLGANTPSAPQNVSVLSGNETLVVNWTPPSFSGTSSITGYTATAFTNLVSTVPVSQCSAGGSATSCRITGLVNNTEYFVSVSATNSSGSGSSSGRISGTPTLIRVPNSPAGVSVTTGVSLLQVSWQAVDTANIEPVIDYTATAYNSSGSAVSTCTTTQTNCLITSLTSGTTYQVSVTARNTLGSSAPSDRVSGMAGYPPDWSPSDPYYVDGTLWGLNGRYGVNAPGAWTRTRGSSSVVVAVIDTGSTSHPDLNSNTVPGYDFISDPSNAADGNGWDSDASDPGDSDGWYSSSWHGTHVAGTIGAVSDSSGVVGVAPSTTLQHVRVLGTRGGSVADIASGIIWASGGSVAGTTVNGTPAKVINMSLGGPAYSCSSTFQTAIDSAFSKGTTVVVAAGNSNEDAGYSSPANCNNVITVAAISSSGNRASFSNYGSYVDIAAPGVGIYSTLNSGSTSPSTPTWASYQGTSMAAPHVAGVVALMLANNPSLTPQLIETNIKNSSNVTPFAGSRCDSTSSSLTCGTGVINASLLLGSTFDAGSGGGSSGGGSSGGGGGGTPAAAGPVVAPAAVSVARPNVSIAKNQKISGSAIAKMASVRLPKGHKVTLVVIGSKSVCRISGGKVQALKPGVCVVSVQVSGQTKVGKKTKTVKTSTTVNVSVS